MHLTKYADYAIRVVTDLAIHPSSRISDIAFRTATPQAFLAKVVRNLVKAGLLRSFRGRKGGVKLAYPPSRITVLQVIEAVEGPFSINLCVPNEATCPLSDFCSARPLWQRLYGLLIQELQTTTIEHLLKK